MVGCPSIMTGCKYNDRMSKYDAMMIKHNGRMLSIMTESSIILKGCQSIMIGHHSMMT